MPWHLHPFPTRRSSDLPPGARHARALLGRSRSASRDRVPRRPLRIARRVAACAHRDSRALRGRQARHGRNRLVPTVRQGDSPDRKSTRLNSSHVRTSYALASPPFPYTTLFRSASRSSPRSSSSRSIAKRFSRPCPASPAPHRATSRGLCSPGFSRASRPASSSWPQPTRTDCPSRRLPRSEEHTSELQSRPHLVCPGISTLSLHDALPICLPELATLELFSVDREALLETVSRVARSASRDESRPVLTGILARFEAGKLVMAATDSYRLSVKETPQIGRAHV